MSEKERVENIITKVITPTLRQGSLAILTLVILNIVIHSMGFNRIPIGPLGWYLGIGIINTYFYMKDKKVRKK